ncbi:MAG: hypothetical protein ABI718_00875 [Acidobacteriota bacterium]
MKAVKIIFGVLTGLRCLALLVQLPGRLAIASSRGSFAASYILGVAVGIIVMGGISFLLFRSALRRPC